MISIWDRGKGARIGSISDDDGLGDMVPALGEAEMDLRFAVAYCDAHPSCSLLRLVESPINYIDECEISSFLCSLITLEDVICISGADRIHRSCKLSVRTVQMVKQDSYSQPLILAKGPAEVTTVLPFYIDQRHDDRGWRSIRLPTTH